MYENYQQQPPKPKRSKKKILGISLGVLAGIIILGGLAGDGDSTSTQADSKPAVTESSTPEPTPSETETAEVDEEVAENIFGEDGEDTAFLMALEMSGMDTFENESDETLVSWGHKACQYKEQGKSDNEASLALENETGGNMFAMAFLVGAAQGSICPETM